MSVQPGCLAGFVPIRPLFDAARPALETQHVISRNPATRARRLDQPVSVPRGRSLGMLQDASPGADSKKSSIEASAVVALFEPGVRRRGATPVAPPSFAWRMRHDRIWAGIETSVPRLVPGINIRHAEIASASLHVESGDHHSLFLHTAKMTPAAANEARETASMRRLPIIAPTLSGPARQRRGVLYVRRATPAPSAPSSRPRRPWERV